MTAPWTVTSLGDAYRTGRRDIRDEVESCLEHAREGSVFQRVTADRARAQGARLAAELERGDDRGPLHGIPVAVKDLFDMVGEVTTAGSPVLAREGAVARVDAAVVQRLERAGAIIIGKTTLTELAYSSLGLNTLGGVPRNAYHRDHVAGGSSSGSAIAVASGRVVAAVGTDTGGSVRVPAAFNGLVGMKPTDGTIPTDGMIHHSFTLDTIGPIARGVADAWHVYQALLGCAGRPLRDAALSGARLVVPLEPYCRELADGVRVAFERVCEALREQGAAVAVADVEVLRDVPSLYQRHGSFSSTELAVLHGTWIERHASEVDPHLVRRVREDRNRTAVEYARLHWERSLVRRRFVAAAADVDAFLMPTTPVTAPRLSDVVDTDGFIAHNAVGPRNTKAWNMLGCPAVTVPCGFDGRGLPVGMMVGGRPGEDEAAFAIASALERVVREQGLFGGSGHGSTGCS